jgi:flagellar biosynthesis/type III secretory pathway protein FliH
MVLPSQTEQTNFVQQLLEQVYLMGVIDGYNAGYQDGVEDAYKVGYQDGVDDINNSVIKPLASDALRHGSPVGGQVMNSFKV